MIKIEIVGSYLKSICLLRDIGAFQRLVEFYFINTFVFTSIDDWMKLDAIILLHF